MAFQTETLDLSKPSTQRASQAVHFSHQTRHLFASQEHRSNGMTLLAERATQRRSKPEFWDFPDGSAVEVRARGVAVTDDVPTSLSKMGDAIRSWMARQVA